MRKMFLTFSAIVTLAMVGNAQTAFGLKAGANFANLKASASGINVSFDTKISFNGGLYATIPVAEGFNIQPEAVLSLEGAKIASQSMALTYLNVPVLLQYNGSGFFAETGPQLGLLMGAKMAGEDLKEEFETVNFSWAAGAGYRLVNGLGFNARYNFGVSNLAKTEPGDEGTMKSNVLQVGLGFTFPGSRR